MRESRELDRIVEDIMEAMTLKEKASIASLKEEEILHFHDLFDTLVIDTLGMDETVGRDVIHRIWELLQSTHRLRRVK